MKKILVIVLTITSLCTLTACGQKGESDNGTYMSAVATIVVNDNSAATTTVAAEGMPLSGETQVTTVSGTTVVTTTVTEPTTTTATTVATTKETTPPVHHIIAPPTTKATTTTTKATTAPTTAATTTTKATTAPTTAPTNNVFINYNNVVYETDVVSIRPRYVYWDGSALVAECFVINGRNTPVYNINVNALYVNNSSGQIAAASFGNLSGLTISPYSNAVWTFRFNSDCINMQGADLGYLLTRYSVNYSY